jgi:hypothetical protein
MKGEKDEKKDDQGSYSYSKCSNCKIKLHISASKCWKCGEKPENMRYRGSKNPDDAIYSRDLNYVEKCMNCYNINYLGKEPCQKMICFATGRGKCEACRIGLPTIFACCQETIKAEPPSTSEDWQRLKVMMGIIGKSEPVPAPTAAPAEFEDDIPF